MKRTLLPLALALTLILFATSLNSSFGETTQLEYQIHVFRFHWVPIETVEPLEGDYIHIQGIGSNKLRIILKYPAQGLSNLRIVKHENLFVALVGDVPIGATCWGVDALEKCLKDYPETSIIKFDHPDIELDKVKDFLKSHPEYLEGKQYILFSSTIKQEGPFLYFPFVGSDSILKFESNHIHGGIYLNVSKEADLELLEKMNVGNSKTALIAVRNPVKDIEVHLAALVKRGIENLIVEYWYDTVTINMKPFSDARLTSLSLLVWGRTIQEGEERVIAKTIVEYPQCTPALKHLRLWKRWRSCDVKAMISRCENLSLEYFSLEETEDTNWEGIPSFLNLRIQYYFEGITINEQTARFLKRAMSSCENLQVLYANELLTGGSYPDVKRVGIAACTSCDIDAFSLFPSATFAQFELTKSSKVKSREKVSIKLHWKCRGLILRFKSDIKVEVLYGEDISICSSSGVYLKPFTFALAIPTTTN